MTPPRWFRGCVTAWAIHVVTWRWQLMEWQRMANKSNAA